MNVDPDGRHVVKKRRDTFRPHPVEYIERNIVALSNFVQLIEHRGHRVRVNRTSPELRVIGFDPLSEIVKLSDEALICLGVIRPASLTKCVTPGQSSGEHGLFKGSVDRIL